MDIIDLIPLIIIGLLYLFGSSAKKKAEEARSKAQNQRPATELEPKQGLQDRLEDALREMQARVEGQRSEGEAPAAERGRASPSTDSDQVANEIGRLTAGTLYDREVYGSKVESEPIGKAGEETFGFHSLMEEVPNEAYHGHGFGGFKQVHGIHYGETDEPAYADAVNRGEFDQAHSLPIHTAGTRRSASRQTPVNLLFSTMDDVQRGVIMAEILGKPKGLRSVKENGNNV